MTAPDDTPVRRAQRAFDALIHALHPLVVHRRSCRDMGGACGECARLYSEHQRAKRAYDIAVAELLGDSPPPSPPTGPAPAAALPMEETGTC